jgi:hypothetical protein
VLKHFLAAAFAAALACLLIPAAFASTPGAKNVKNFGAQPNDSRDDTAAFQSAIRAAASHRIRPHGPDGTRQGVVYVPAGSYRVCGVQPSSNVRIEFNAGAKLLMRESGCANPAAILLDGGAKNVSIIGIGRSSSGKPASLAGRDVAHKFVINADPAVTGTTTDQKAIAVRWASYALIKNVITIQNQSRTSTGQNTRWTSHSPALTFYGLPTSTKRRPRLPQHIRVRNVFNTRSPVSYGAIQVSACIRCSFAHVFSNGGVALRLETDAEEAYYLRTGQHYFSKVGRIRARDIMGYHGRQALTFSPHSQTNGVVRVVKVVARSTYSAVRLADTHPPGTQQGSFSGRSLVRRVLTRPGTKAQIQMEGSVGWRIGPSWRAVDDAAGAYTVRFRNVHCGGLPSSTSCG